MITIFPDYLSHAFEFDYADYESAPANQIRESNLLPPLPSSIPDAPPANPAQLGPDSNPYGTLLLNYINDKLMEEDMEGANCILQDELALQAAENSFYQALIDEFPPGEYCPPGVRQNAQEKPDLNFPEEYCTPGVRQNAKENPYVNFFNPRLMNSLEKTSPVSDSGCNSFPSFFGAQETRGRKNYERRKNYEKEGGGKNSLQSFSMKPSYQECSMVYSSMKLMAKSYKVYITAFKLVFRV